MSKLYEKRIRNKNKKVELEIEEMQKKINEEKLAKEMGKMGERAADIMKSEFNITKYEAI